MRVKIEFTYRVVHKVWVLELAHTAASLWGGG